MRLSEALRHQGIFAQAFRSCAARCRPDWRLRGWAGSGYRTGTLGFFSSSQFGRMRDSHALAVALCKLLDIVCHTTRTRNHSVLAARILSLTPFRSVSILQNYFLEQMLRKLLVTKELA